MACELHKNNQPNCIACVPIFSNLTEEESLEIMNITTSKTFEKGDMVYMAGDKGGTLFIIYTGRVKISRLNANGKEQVIRVIGPGEFMGELSLFSSLQLTDNAQVLETCTMCVIEGEKLKELMAKYISVAFKIMDELSNRLDKAETLIEAINLDSVEQRLAKSLLSLSADGNEAILNMTKGDFASQLGMSQETLSRKLTVFQDEGIIKLKGHKSILILDKDALEEISQY